MKKYYLYAEAGDFWDVFPACVIVGRQYYEAFPVVGVDSWGRKVNWDRHGEYYEKGEIGSLGSKKLKKVEPAFFSILDA